MTRKRFIDIGANLTDPQFYGVYRGKQRHASDFVAMLARARAAGCEKMLVTGSDLEESRAALALAEAHPPLFSTCGVHPCSASGVPKAPAAAQSYWSDLEALAVAGRDRGQIKAFGEFGLDYDRLHYASKEEQLSVFAQQLEIAARVGLPLFLHMRACAEDFIGLMEPWIKEHAATWKGGVVHSFTGTLGELERLLGLGLYIGINGCSLKTDENLAVARAVPLDKLMLETDGPWCEIRPSHASAKYLTQGSEALRAQAFKPEKFREGAMVRGRCEPCQIQGVAEVVAGIKGIELQEVVEAAYRNTVRVFGLHTTIAED